MEFADRSTLVFFLFLPLLFTFLIGLAQGGGAQNRRPADTRIRLAVIDDDHSALSGRLVAALHSSAVLRVQESPDRAQAQEQVAANRLPAALVIPAGFGAQITGGQPAGVELLQSSTTAALAVDQAIQAAVRQVSGAVGAAQASLAAYEQRQSFANPAERQRYFERSLEQAWSLVSEPPAAVQVENPSQVNPRTAIGFNQSSPGQLVTWVLITLLSVGETLVNERLGGTLRRLLTTPTSKAIILLGKALGWLAMSLLQIGILIGFGALVLGVHWGRSPGALALVAVSFACAALGLGMLMGAYARTRSQASGLVTLLGMLLASLGGAWWPVEITPPLYQTVVKALPTTWAMQGFNDIILRGQPVSGVVLEAAVLLGFALVFFTAAVRRLRFE